MFSSSPPVCRPHQPILPSGTRFPCQHHRTFLGLSLLTSILSQSQITGVEHVATDRDSLDKVSSASEADSCLRSVPPSSIPTIQSASTQIARHGSKMRTRRQPFELAFLGSPMFTHPDAPPASFPLGRSSRRWTCSQKERAPHAGKEASRVSGRQSHRSYVFVGQRTRIRRPTKPGHFPVPLLLDRCHNLIS